MSQKIVSTASGSEQTISAGMDARLERWAYHLCRQGVVSTAPWRRAATPAPASPDSGSRPLVDSEFQETQALIARLDAEDRILVTVWYTAADRREIPAWFARSGPRRPLCRQRWPWPRALVMQRLAVDRCRCPACLQVPSYAGLYQRLARIHRQLWRMLHERRHGLPAVSQAPSQRVTVIERAARRTLAHVAPLAAPAGGSASGEDSISQLIRDRAQSATFRRSLPPEKT